MSLFRNIYNHHKAYYETQSKATGNFSIKKFLLILIIGIPYIAFFMLGANLDANTIVSHRSLLLITSMLAVVAYGLIYLFSDRFKSDLRIITNIIIFYIHSVLFFSTILLLLNYFTIKNDFEQTKLPVMNWEETSSRSGEKTYAQVMDQDEISWLEFKGHILEEVNAVEFIQMELARGILGYGYINSFEIEKSK